MLISPHQKHKTITNNIVPLHQDEQEARTNFVPKPTNPD